MKLRSLVVMLSLAILTVSCGGDSEPETDPTGSTEDTQGQDRCAVDVPDLVDRLGTGHPSACHFAEVVTPKER